MAAVHRHGDSRSCGATTIVEGQTNVFVNGKLWSVENDPNSHGEGRLQSVVGNTIKINGKNVIVLGDIAGTDLLFHPTGPTNPSSASDTVFAY